MVVLPAITMESALCEIVLAFLAAFFAPLSSPDSLTPLFFAFCSEGVPCNSRPASSLSMHSQMDSTVARRTSSSFSLLSLQ